MMNNVIFHGIKEPPDGDSITPEIASGKELVCGNIINGFLNEIVKILHFLDDMILFHLYWQFYILVGVGQTSST